MKATAIRQVRPLLKKHCEPSDADRSHTLQGTWTVAEGERRHTEVVLVPVCRRM
jgi:hypothetical protein